MKFRIADILWGMVYIAIMLFAAQQTEWVSPSFWMSIVVTSIAVGVFLASHHSHGRLPKGFKGLDIIVALGSLRAGRQCQSCHSIERGALIGALSYSIDKRR